MAEYGMQYRRNRIPGGTYFFTVNLRDRRSDLLTSQIAALRDAVRHVRTQRPFHIDAFVVLPEHLHCVWTLPAGDDDFPGRWRAIKTRFAKAMSSDQMWQPRYWEHTIRDARDYSTHVDYTHFNPVKHGYVDHPALWPHSTFLRCVARGMYPLDWRFVEGELGEMGEAAGG